MNTEILDALETWKEFTQKNADNPNPGLIIDDTLQIKFARICVQCNARDIIKIGIEIGFSLDSLINIIILHGGYFKLLKEGFITRENCRHLDSLYHQSSPHLYYNTNNPEILATWITLSAQEILLDLNLKEYVAVEYGSGISTFFYERETIECYSFEDDPDLIQGKNWSEIMAFQASHLGRKLNLIKPTNNLTN